jgi:hypothetical protein
LPPQVKAFAGQFIYSAHKDAGFPRMDAPEANLNIIIDIKAEHIILRFASKDGNSSHRFDKGISGDGSHDP